MPKSLMLTFSEPVSPDLEDEFLRWYTDVHIPEMRAAAPQIVEATLYVASDVHQDTPGARRYLTVYEVESDDIAGVYRQIREAGRAGNVNMSGSLRREPQPLTLLYQPVAR